jgi:hypothetical protein
MPLTKLTFKPGVNREMTSYSNEGSWFQTEKVRFRFGFPEKIGGWQKDTGSITSSVPIGTFVSGGTTSPLLPASGTFWGESKSLYNWLNLSGYNLLGIGTNLKYYIQYSPNGTYYDVTPIRYQVTVASNAFTTANTSTTVTCNVTANGAQVGDFVIISGVATAINGIPAASLNQEFRIASIVDSNTFTIVVNTPATSSGTTGAATFDFQTSVGNAAFSYASGWGTGGWGGYNGSSGISTGWGQSSAAGVGVIQRLWSQAPFGENLLFAYGGGPMNFWAVNPVSTVFDRGQVMVAGGSITQKNYATGSGTTSVSIDATCPSQVNQVMVSDSTRFVIALGCNDPTGVVTTAALDPLQVRWSDQESYSVWTPAVTNQAGSYRLSQGSQIVTGIQTRQEILIFTDLALYSMQYIGAPYVWSFQPMGSNISIISPNSVVTANNLTFWMGIDKFYVYSGKVDTLPCSLRRDIFDNINSSQGYQVYGGQNEGFNEIWWFYCSANSNVPDKYVIYNYVENTWYNGTLSRTSWLGSRLRTYPMACNYDSTNQSGNLIYHESGVDDGSVNPAVPIAASIQSADFDIGDGDHFAYVWRMVPDVTFDGSTGSAPVVNMTMLPRQNPGATYGNTDNPTVTSGNNYTSQRTFAVQKFTQYAYVRVRGRQMSLQISSNTLGVQWQLGSPRLDTRADGRR